MNSSSLSFEVIVSDTIVQEQSGDAVTNVDIASAPDGSFVATWIQQQFTNGEAGNQSVYEQRFDANGKAFSSAQVLSVDPAGTDVGGTVTDFYARDVSATEGADGTTLIAYLKGANAARIAKTINITRINPKTNQPALVSTITIPGSDAVTNVDIASAPDGSFVATWIQQQFTKGEAGNQSVYEQRFDANGKALSSAQVLSVDPAGTDVGETVTDFYARDVSATEGADGTTLIAYLKGANAARIAKTINITRINPKTNQPALVSTITIPGSDAVTNVDIASAPDGSFVATWIQQQFTNGEAGNQSVYEQRFDANGKALSSAQVLSVDPAGTDVGGTVTDFYARDVSATEGADGTTLIAYLKGANAARIATQVELKVEKTISLRVLPEVGSSVNITEGGSFSAGSVVVNLSTPSQYSIDVHTTLDPPDDTGHVKTYDFTIPAGVINWTATVVSATDNHEIDEAQTGNLVFTATSQGLPLPFFSVAGNTASQSIPLEISDAITAPPQGPDYGTGISYAKSMVKYWVKATDIASPLYKLTDIEKQYLANIKSFGKVFGVTADLTKVYVNFHSDIANLATTTDPKIQAVALYRAEERAAVDISNIAVKQAVTTGSAAFIVGVIEGLTAGAVTPTLPLLLPAIKAGLDWATSGAYDEYVAPYVKAQFQADYEQQNDINAFVSNYTTNYILEHPSSTSTKTSSYQFEANSSTALYAIDPVGSELTLLESSSSPKFASIVLPHTSASSYLVSVHNGGQWSTPVAATAEQELDWAGGVDGIRVVQLGADGKPLSSPGDFVFNVSFASTGHFVGTVVTADAGREPDDITTGSLVAPASVSDPSGTQTASGSFGFMHTAGSSSDSVAVSFDAAKSSTTAAVGFLVPVVSSEPVNGAPGQVGWTYKVADSQIAKLTAGQTLTEVFDVTVDDHRGDKTVTPITVTLTGSAAAATPMVTGHLVNDTGASATDRITKNDALTGVGEAYATVRFSVDGKAVIDTVQADANGVWGYTPAGLKDGSHVVVASETNAAGTGKSTFIFTLDTTPPVPTLSGASTAGAQTTLSGTVSPNSTVTVLDGSTVLGSAKAGADGIWSLGTQLSSAPIHSFTTTATDLAGNTGSAAEQTVYAPGGNAALIGGTGNDILIGRPDNTLTGGAGHDTFVFTPNFGQETITDFTPTFLGPQNTVTTPGDVLQIAHTLFVDFNAVMSHAQQVGANTLITADPMNTITLKNTQVANLHAQDFHFA